MKQFAWRKFVIIWTLGMLGAVAVLPYSFSLQADALAEVPLPLPVLVLVSLLQAGVLLGVLVWLGNRLSVSVGFKTPVIDALITRERPIRIYTLLKRSVFWSVTVAVVMLGTELFFQSIIPSLGSIESPSVWQGLLASFYGAFTEEIIMRYFLMSLFVWVLCKVFGAISTRIIWLAIFVSAILFGSLHLPAMATFVDLTSLIIIRTLMLNSIAAIAFGYLYWRHGLEAAMASHFVTDIILQIGSRIL